MLTTSVGSPLAVSVNVRDISERDPNDFRFREAVPIEVGWYQHQGPMGGEIEFARHESTQVRESDSDEDDEDAEDPPNTIWLSQGQGLAQVYATFSTPGEYLLRAQADSFSAPDSGSQDQCCWTNGYVRVNVSP